MTVLEYAPQGLRQVRSLVVLGDSTAVGLGDPLPGGGWRGVGPFLADALSGTEQVLFANVSINGARMGDVRSIQLPQALAVAPEVAVIIVGMNDTLRSDFDPERIRADLGYVVGELKAAGAIVLTVRFHDHAKVFRLPGPLRRALRSRISALNSVIDSVSAAHDAGCLDLDLLPGAYEMGTWSVDRLHPSELGHRLLAQGFAGMLADRGCAIPRPVSLTCSGGRQVGTAGHVVWLIVKGIPWLWRRGRDLVPYAVSIMVKGVVGPPR
ncbi:SGNH/GDSL hydrolase family protein [Kibdelosporangium phytohabitans]|uniref:SGNH hydrolase n=1 Tax=Kibdelosporangium phytohabitans TaxID=860235 RepID=A0A0N7F4K8_9PSEU|nr:SGNH/GDSL hydrolase family protein [Kibdelosporangium phytohabitans]ALG11711.1 SGNH hydrolase [Kibdelosporangium phytohabitans]MBE1463107.1 lysophospholipase L1-like esterase [Kibdelosporangium phytohabitans]